MKAFFFFLIQRLASLAPFPLAPALTPLLPGWSNEKPWTGFLIGLMEEVGAGHGYTSAVFSRA